MSLVQQHCSSSRNRNKLFGLKSVLLQVEGLYQDRLEGRKQGGCVHARASGGYCGVWTSKYHPALLYRCWYIDRGPTFESRAMERGTEQERELVPWLPKRKARNQENGLICWALQGANIPLEQ